MAAHISALSAAIGPYARIYHTPTAARTPLDQALRLFHPAALQRWLGPDGSALAQLIGRDEVSKPAPVVVEAASAKYTVTDLQRLIVSALPELESVVRHSGAILFRGWQLRDPVDFDSALRSLRSRPTDFFGTAPRYRLDGSEYLFRNVAFESAGRDDTTVEVCSRDEHSGLSVHPDEVQRMIEQVVKGNLDLAPLVAMVSELENERGGLDDELKLKLNVVFADTTLASKSHPQLFNYHNELAYLTPELHGAPFGAFACLQAPELGGATLLADCRRVLETLHVSLSLGEQGSGVPTDFRYVIARKPRDGVCIPRKTMGDYEGFLTGEYELDGVVDQWNSSEGPTGEAGLRARAASLGLEVVEQEHDLAVYSPWVPTHRPYVIGSGGTMEETWWLNGNHMMLGAKGHRSLPFQFRFPDGIERAPTLTEARTIAAAYWRESSFIPWQQGDLLIFSNQLVAHNASPGIGARQILPSFGNMF